MNYKVLVGTKDLDRTAWLRRRQAGIGGSDASGILGVSNFSSPLKVFLEKTTEIADEQEEQTNEAMRQGHDLEEYCASRFEEQTGKRVRRVNAIIQHHSIPYIIANIDRRVDGEDAILECKTTKSTNAKMYSDGKVPAAYEAQCHHYMLATGASRCYLAVLVLGADFHVFTYERDPEMDALMLSEYEKFWNEHVLTGTPPPFDGSQAGDDILKAKYPGHEPGAMVELPADTAKQTKDYLEYLSLIKDLTAKADTIKQGLLDRIGEAEYGTVGGEVVARRIWVSGRESVDTKRLKAEKPEIYQAYTKSGSGYARLEVKEG